MDEVTTPTTAPSAQCSRVSFRLNELVREGRNEIKESRSRERLTNSIVKQKVTIAVNTHCDHPVKATLAFIHGQIHSLPARGGTLTVGRQGTPTMYKLQTRRVGKCFLRLKMADSMMTPSSIKQKIEQALQAEHVVRTLYTCIGYASGK